MEMPESGDAETVTAMVPEAVGTATGRRATVTTEAARQALTEAAGSMAVRWVIAAN